MTHEARNLTHEREAFVIPSGSWVAPEARNQREAFGTGIGRIQGEEGHIWRRGGEVVRIEISA